jgi:hypothetical protein
MDKTTIEFGRWRIVRRDPKNWQLHERKLILEGKRAGSVDWVDLDSYHGTLMSALESARKREFESKGCTVDLDGALSELRKIDRKFIRDLKDALEGE